MSEVRLEGGCHCGTIRFRITGPEPHTGYCHCRDCQKVSGAPAQTWMDVRLVNFEVLSEAPSVYKSSDKGRRHFCPICGSQLYFSSLDDVDFVYPQVGALDDPELVKPSMHIWTDSQISWFKVDDHLPRFPRNAPED